MLVMYSIDSVENSRWRSIISSLVSPKEKEARLLLRELPTLKILMMGTQSRSSSPGAGVVEKRKQGNLGASLVMTRHTVSLEVTCRHQERRGGAECPCRDLF